MSGPAADGPNSAAATPRALAVAALAEPTRRVPAGWIAAFAAAWLGIWMGQLAPMQLLLPLQVDAARGGTGAWQDSVLAFGAISGIAGVCALIAFPVTGALSDRTTSRFGRRRPWIAAGTAVFAIGLAVLGTRTDLVGIGIWWCVALTGFCILTAALTATISDQVPVGQRGVVSAWLSAPQAVGIILGVGLVTALGLSQLVGYLVVAALLVVLVLPFLLRTPDAVLPPAARARLGLGAILADLWIPPRTHPDFAWTLTSRILVNIGNALGTSLLLYFLEFGLGMGAGAEDGLLVLTVVYMVFVIAAALVAGPLSDRWGRRKPFVAFAAALQALAAVLLGLVPDFSVAIVGGALLGLGYGCFLAVDQALATQVLPDPADRGKDLGIMNIATAVPQAVAPLLGALVVASFGGFPGLFLLAGATALLGALAALPIRSVR